MADSRWQQLYSDQQPKKVTVQIAGCEAACHVSEPLLWAIKNACDAEFLGNSFVSVASANVTLRFSGREVKYDISANLAMSIKLSCDAEFSGNFLNYQLGMPSTSQAVVTSPFPDFLYSQAQQNAFMPSPNAHSEAYAPLESAFSTTQAVYPDASMPAQLCGQPFSKDKASSDIEASWPVSLEDGYFYLDGQPDGWQLYCPPDEGQEVDDDSYSRDDEFYPDEESAVGCDRAVEEDPGIVPPAERIVTPGFSPGFFQAFPRHDDEGSYGEYDMSTRLVSGQR